MSNAVVYGAISKACYGVRLVMAYEKPFEFNIVVNNMTDVMQHEDVALPRPDNYSVQSSAADWGYNVVTSGKSKRP